MTTEEARRVLHSPYKPLVLAALSYVNLTDQEQNVLILRHMRGHTQEQVAEEIRYSVNGLQKVEYKALDKCAKAWTGLCFVRELLALDEQAKP